VSAPIHHGKDLDPALIYAPPRVRDQNPTAETESTAPPVDWPWRRQRGDDAHLSEDDDKPLTETPRRLTLDPDWVPEPPADDGRDLWKLTLRAGGVLGFAALIAWVVVSIPGARRFGHETLQASLSGATVSGDTARQAAAAPPAAAMLRQRTDAQDGGIEKTVQQARSHLDGGFALASASAGPTVGRQTVVIASNDQAPILQPPLAAVAARDPEPAPATAAARDPEPPPQAIAARDPEPPPQPAAVLPTPPQPTQAEPSAPQPIQAQPVQPQPIQPQPEQAQPAPAPPPAAAPQPESPSLVVRQLDRDEIASLLRRSEEFIKSGDLASARLLLRRAAEAGDMHAALTLAGTFDPNVLRTLGSPELGADVAKARLWYERAQRFGSTEAPRRLQELANAASSAR
jgi:hypothetical protein